MSAIDAGTPTGTSQIPLALDYSTIKAKRGDH
jgi:hypothetical protein